MTGDIAAGEIRERENEHRWEARFYGVVKGPAGIGDGLYATATVLKRTEWRYIDMAGLHVTLDEARDFARAILAAADWAERQGR